MTFLRIAIAHVLFVGLFVATIPLYLLVAVFSRTAEVARKLDPTHPMAAGGWDV